MPEQKQSAPPKTMARRFHDARVAVVAEAYSPEDIAVMLAGKVASYGGGRVAVVALTDIPGELQETLTVITSMTRADRVWAAVYSVKVGNALTEEFTVPHGSPLWILATDAAQSVL